MVVFGFAPANVPLASLLPQGIAGCVLRVQPDVLVPLVPSAGAIAHSLSLPAAPSLVGVSLHEQCVSLEITASGQFVAARSSNALHLVTELF